ncbi:PREDICTED: uncharacterized protein LOC104592448 [Nelumbo nucifera]|uniref:Uncharacterized protein LOC104592448 n=1 Tax=Nelumbo nucifera TaxID=4432 RepID=A0A1U7ZBS9_NELNU|nr:PREDICTED: uncharacterized protein LOC104592448 [Nelumbo nucifera]
MPCANVLAYTPSVSTVIGPSNPGRLHVYPPTTRTLYNNRNTNSIVCKASTSPSSSITEFDLYDLLGIDSTSNRSQIKAAYRSLQKQCHPDIAGPAGHDMAIILNEAYSILSDPSSRSVYDKEQAKIEEFRGYTGKPIYSTWFGSEKEERAVFVDEVKCIGCLKCALVAQNTFAIESVYGRARAVGQWADPELKIQEAIEACPVDCISMVERSNLAALEFLMFRQPRGSVRISAGNAVGTRVSNIFVDVKKFQSRYQETKGKASQRERELDLQREARMSAIQAIRSISNWWYWKPPKSSASGSTIDSNRNLACLPRKATNPNIDKLRDAAAARKLARENAGEPAQGNPKPYIHGDEYWTPTTPLILPATTQSSKSNRVLGSSPTVVPKVKHVAAEDYRGNPLRWRIPVVTATVGAAIVRLQVGDRVGDGLNQHIGGSLALEIVNSSWLQAILAGLAWYFIGMAMVELVEVLRIKQRKAENGVDE